MSNDYADDLEELINGAILCIESAYMSEDFLKGVDQSIGEIPNLVEASNQEPDVNQTDTA
jgi:hypothetical protein